MMRLLLGIIIWVALSASSMAHEVRPAFLSLTETAPSQFSVTWKQPVLDGKRLKIVPTFPEGCSQSASTPDRKGATIVERSVLNCELIEGKITLAGLERTLTDVFAEINYLSGETRTALVKPSNPTLTLGGKTSSPAKHYLWIGVEHIIYGWDHLLFVIGLTLLVARRQILGVATAFTQSQCSGLLSACPIILFRAVNFHHGFAACKRHLIFYKND